jgi:hypothetical protein
MDEQEFAETLQNREAWELRRIHEQLMLRQCADWRDSSLCLLSSRFSLGVLLAFGGEPRRIAIYRPSSFCSRSFCWLR